MNQYSFPEKESDQFMNKNQNDDDNGNNQKDIDKKLKSMRKALKEITDAMEYAPNDPQLLVLMANFIGFSFKEHI